MSSQRKIRPVVAAAALAAALGAAALPGTAFASGTPSGAPSSGAPAVERARDSGPDKHAHNLPGPLTERENAKRQEAIKQLVSGEADIKQRGASKSLRLGKNKYVELDREKTDKIFTILVEFGDKVDTSTMHDPDGSGPQPPVVKYGGSPGPAHNQIPEPDRSKDNTTIWQPDFDRKHYEDLYFAKEGESSVATYYEKQSSGRYSVDGVVSDWVKVEYNEARYGSNWCGGSTCRNAWDLVRDGANQWVADQRAAGRTDAEIRADLAAYDEWDRYDFDGDGNFNERDGYIDHFQIVHAGEDESAGGGQQGTDALWAHRWYAYVTDAGRTGPEGNRLGGAEIGGTGLWVGDYTLQPENGGLGVFAHEYGHDLGLPDHYDTTYVGENSSAFWTLMSGGSWLSDGTTDIGSMPGDMSAWDKLQLGWLDFETAKAATDSTHTLGVAEYNTANPQALVVELPKKPVTTTIATPAEGAKQWWSGQGDSLRNTLTRSVDLTGKSDAALRLKGWYEIEDGYDYLYTEVSTDGGATWTALDGTAGGQALPRDGGGTPALTGESPYTDLAFPLSAYAGQKIDLRFRYQTDSSLTLKGFAADAISVTADGAALFTDGAETDDAGWTANGFSRIGEGFTKEYAQYYIAENRQYVSYDRVLRTGPYNVGDAANKPDWVERFPYQNGLLISLWDTSQSDNDVGNHPGEGLILPVDAHGAKPLKWSDGTYMRTRIQAFDATFSWYPTDGFTLHRNGVPTKVRPQAGVPVFDDRKGTYWSPETPYASVKVPDTNTRISIVSETPFHSPTMKIKVSKSTK
ncbi:immune inhibitor A [Streptomyces capparidis]